MKVPVDEQSLRLLKESLDASYDVDDAGEHVLVGAEFSLHRLLEFWSGYDKSKLVLTEGDVYEYSEPLIHTNDVIRALVSEIERLREEYEN